MCVAIYHPGSHSLASHQLPRQLGCRLSWISRHPLVWQALKDQWHQCPEQNHTYSQHSWTWIIVCWHLPWLWKGKSPGWIMTPTQPQSNQNQYFKTYIITWTHCLSICATASYKVSSIEMSSTTRQYLSVATLTALTSSLSQMPFCHSSLNS